MSIYFQKQDSDKRIWMISYGSACKSITSEMMSEAGLIVDECYTVLWRESKYTLFHLSRQNRTRATAIYKMLKNLKEAHGIIDSGLFGFDSVSCNDEVKGERLNDHPGFRHMVHILNENRDGLEWWMQSGDLDSNRKGLLWKHLECTDPSLMTRFQLVQRVRTLGPLVKEVGDLKGLNTTLEGQLRAVEKSAEQAWTSYHKERKCSDDFFDQLRAKIRECHYLKSKNDELQARIEELETLTKTAKVIGE